MSGRHSNVHRSSKTPSGLYTLAREAGEVEALRQNEVAYKTRIRSLELELDTLKSRLDSLRKAKNTTIVRRDREQVRISSPKLGRRLSSVSSLVSSRPSTTSIQRTTPSSSPCHHGNLPKQIEELRRQVNKLDGDVLSERCRHDQRCEELTNKHRRNMADLRETSEREIGNLKGMIERMKSAQNQENVVCQKYEDLLPDLERLRTENRQLSEKLEDVLTVNHKLRGSNLLLQGKCETLLDDLSVKEARWTQREDAFKAEIRKQWGERYHEWMVKAEKKMEELQQVNTLLQGMLRTKQHDPDL